MLLAGALLVAAACGGSDDEAGDGPSDSNEATTDTADTDTTNTGTADTGTTADAGEPAPTVSENAIEQDTVDDDADPVPGGTLRYGIEADVDGLNPTTSALSAPGQLMANAVFDNITAYDVDNNAVPYLAETIEPVDGDLSTWQVTLREGITFHDGTPLNAEAAQISRPLMLHIAEKDQFCPPEAQSKIIAAAADASSVTAHSYAGVDHAFARQGGAHYDQAAADLANERTAAFFKENLA